MKIPVTFSYRDWITNSMDRAALKPGVSNNLTTLQKILKVGTIVQTVSTMRSPKNIGDAIGVLNNANIIRF
jgi:rRNA maturation protein Rpf1